MNIRMGKQIFILIVVGIAIFIIVTMSFDFEIGGYLKASMHRRSRVQEVPELPKMDWGYVKKRAPQKLKTASRGNSQSPHQEIVPQKPVDDKTFKKQSSRIDTGAELQPELPKVGVQENIPELPNIDWNKLEKKVPVMDRNIIDRVIDRQIGRKSYTNEINSKIKKLNEKQEAQSENKVETDYESVNGTLFKGKPLVIWSNDFHIGPIRDLKDLLQPLGVRFIDYSLSGACTMTKTCAYWRLRVVNPWNGIELHPRLIQMFYDVYKDDPQIQSVDAFICFHPAAMCELFIPFNKSIIVVASTRYELGRHDPTRWRSWNKNLKRISKDPKNVVAANNKYDAEYIKYFTGIHPQVLTSYCGYVDESYNPTRPGFLLAPIHHGEFHNIFVKTFKKIKQQKHLKVDLTPLRELYPGYQFSDLTAHQGIVYVPYQVSVMSFFEQYRLNIPLFFPSLELLSKWQFQFHVVSERTWSQVGGRIPDGSPIPGVQLGTPDPNDDKNFDSIQYWLKFSDFYTFPHIILYSSIEDLIDKMDRTNLREVSKKMKEYNIKFKAELLSKWKTILKNIYKRSGNHNHHL